MNRLFAMGLSIATFFLSLFNVLGDGVRAPLDESDFVPVIRFVVASDTHVKNLGDVRSKRIKNVFALAYDDAKQDDIYNRLDAFFFAGDLTDNGRKSQFLAFESAIKLSAENVSKVHGILAKSHDCRKDEKKNVVFYEDISDNPSDFHYVINDFHFIGISTSKTEGENYSEYQRQWLKEQLDVAVSEGKDKPIFVINHEHITDTVYGSYDEDGWGIDYFKDIISQYPQIIDFSGHSHYPLNDPRSIWQGEFTAVGTGAIHYAEFTVDGKSRIHPKNNKKIAQCWIVEVDKDNNVRLRGFDALSGTMLCEYILSDVANAENRQYTPEKMQVASTAPQFEENAELKVKRGLFNYKVTVPCAKSTDSNPVFLYRATIYDESGKEVSSKYILNDYWRYPCYSEVTFKLPLKLLYSVEIVAENSYGKQSEPLRYFVTAK